MDNLLEFLKEFNIQTILSVIVVFWYFSRDIKCEMKILGAKIDRQSDRTDRLYEMFIDLLKNDRNNSS